MAVPCRTKDVLLPLIQRWILPGSIISSGKADVIDIVMYIIYDYKLINYLVFFNFSIEDCWKPYDGIMELPEQYKHLKVNHSKEFKSKEGCCTNTIEGMW